MEFKGRKAWKKNRSVLKKRTTPGGQIIYKGETEVYEEDEDGKRVAIKTDRFLIRVAKAASQQVTGTTAEAMLNGVTAEATRPSRGSAVMGVGPRARIGVVGSAKPYARRNTISPSATMAIARAGTPRPVDSSMTMESIAYGTPGA